MLPLALLAGGVATRLRPLTEKIPKALIDVNGEPFIAHQLRLLRAAGLERVIVCSGYLGDMIRAYVADGGRFGLEVQFSLDGPTLLGTGGAIVKALPLLGEAFFVLYGDAYLTCDFRSVESAFRDAGCPALMTVFRNEDHWDTSNVEFDGTRIVSYSKADKSPRMRYIDYGLG